MTQKTRQVSFTKTT